MTPVSRQLYGRSHLVRKLHKRCLDLVRVWTNRGGGGDSVLLGRWGRPTSDIEMSIKVLQNNVDHCGTCEPPFIAPRAECDRKIDAHEEYMRPFVQNESFDRR